MTNSQDANFSCDRIHNFIQLSGLHYVINQTPWSSYITIRKRFIAPASAVEPSDHSEEMRIIHERNKLLQDKLESLQQELVDTKEENVKEKHNNETRVDYLHSKMEKLENALKNKEAELVGLKKEKKQKDKIITNINAGFNKQVRDLSDKLNEVEAQHKKSVKNEKKALKKQRQTVKKVYGDVISDSKFTEDIIEKDRNENSFQLSSKIDDTQDCDRNFSVHADFQNNINLPSPSATLLPSLATKQKLTGRPPSTPPSPHTPPGSPPPPAPLTDYFGDPSLDLCEDTLKIKTVVTADYIKSISKINLLTKLNERTRGQNF